MSKATPLRRLCLFGREGGGGERVALTHFFCTLLKEFLPPPPPIQHLFLLHGSGSVLMF